MRAKVALLMPRYSGRGGTETVVNKLATYFQKSQEIDFQIIMSQGMENYDWLTADVQPETNSFLPQAKLLRYASGLWYLAKYVKQTEADIVICLNTNLLRVASFFKKLYHKDFVLVSWIHFSLFHEAAVNQKVLSLADCHLAISTGIEKQLLELGIPQEHIYLVYNPVTPKKENIPASQSHKRHFVYIGRLMLDGQKNFRFLLENLVAFKGENWQLDVYGSGQEDQKIKELTNHIGLANQVIYHGWVDDPWGKIKEADGLLLTSVFEGFPMVLLEACAYGLPCLTSNCPTGPEDIITESNGYLYPVGDEEAFQMYFSELLAGASFDKSSIKKSIQTYYDENYFTNFQQILYKIIS